MQFFKRADSAERCISLLFLFSSPLSLETCNPPLDIHHGKIPDPDTPESGKLEAINVKS